MNHFLHNILLLLAACLSIVACSDVDDAEVNDRKGIEITVNCVNLNTSRATAAGELALNENKISTLHYFLYRSGQTNQNAVMHGKIDIAEGTQNSTIVRLPMSETELNNVVFPLPYNDCDVYIIANLPYGILPNDINSIANTSIDALKTLVITADFASSPTQPSFVMDGQGKATIISRNKTIAATASIELDRLAAKFTTRISVAESFTDTDGKVWIPRTDQMLVHINNAVSNTTLGATFGDQHFNYDVRPRIGTKTETVEGRSKTLHAFAPFYSYPCQWKYLDEDALVLFIVLPWYYQENGSMTYKECYYKVYPNTQQLIRNNWYNIDLHIGVLGSFTKTDPPVELEDFTYKVIDWKNGFNDWSAGLDIQTELLSAHYLVMEKTEFAVNNKNEFDIPFITSHNCVIKDLEVTRMNFGTTNDPKATPEDITDEAETGNWISIVGNTIRLRHTLNNDFINTTDYDYSPYTFKFTLCHENNQENFYEEITIVQKPAISITAHLNSLYEYNENKNGYQYVNGTAANENGSGNYGGAWGLRGGNTNPYMYTIEVTVLPPGSSYILGDPRSEESSVPPGNNAATAPDIDGTGERKLKKYYGTKTDASVENMIAPKFRIASSHGVTNSISHANAINRAATYQEDGYPAGRWRVPTMAEVLFMVKLSADGKIPTLFSAGSAYWCANGKVTPQNGGGVNTSVGTSGNNGPVRCVYDDWYWESSQYPRMESRGEHPNKYNQFTWGDED